MRLARLSTHRDFSGDVMGEAKLGGETYRGPGLLEGEGGGEEQRGELVAEVAVGGRRRVETVVRRPEGHSHIQDMD
jgi:hypothetical protein